MAKKDNQQMYWILGAIAIVVFVIGGQQGWFKSLTTVNIPPYIEIPKEQQPSILPSCNDACIQVLPDVFESGYQLYYGECKEGETKLTYTGRDKVCCCVPFEVEEEDDFHEDLECKAGCGIRGYDTGSCLHTPYVEGSVKIGICSLTEDNCYCWNEEEPIPDEFDCYDSDGYVDIYTPGYVTDFRGTFYDVCTDTSTIKEYFCKGDSGATSIQTCPFGYECFVDECVAIDSDGDGYSDLEEEEAGTNPNDSNSYPSGGPAEQCIDICKDEGFAGASYRPEGTDNSCMGYGYDTCFPVFGLQYESSDQINDCCCFDCVGW